MKGEDYMGEKEVMIRKILEKLKQLDIKYLNLIYDVVSQL